MLRNGEGQRVLKNKGNSRDPAQQIANAGRPYQTDGISSAKLQGIRSNKIKDLSLVEIPILHEIQ